MTQVLQHVVLFKFTDETTDADVEKISTAFANLENEIDEVLAFEGGSDVSVEGLQNGFTHCFTITLDGEEGREAYLPHPAHKAFGALVTPHVDKVTVIDYWAEV